MAKVVLKIDSYIQKENVISGLVNSGYIISSEKVEDSLGRFKHWKVIIHNVDNEDIEQG